MNLEDIKEKRKAFQRALAYLRRARRAQIPEEHLRINSSSFSELLDPTYISKNTTGYREIFGKDYGAKDVKEFAETVYAHPEALLNNPYILIDGGNPKARRRAAFALLFRFILNDTWAYYSECIPIAHEFEYINTKSELTRNDWVFELKQPDVLYLAEFDKTLVNAHFYVGSFFEDILVHRSINHKLTIISFADPISETNIITNQD